MDVARLYGTSNRQYWWELPMDLEAVRNSVANFDAEDVMEP